jgi:hypothetical protein
MLHVPSKECRVRPVHGETRQLNQPFGEGIIALAVRELSFELAAYHESKLRRHAHIATIKQPVDIATQEQPVAYLM